MRRRQERGSRVEHAAVLMQSALECGEGVCHYRRDPDSLRTRWLRSDRPPDTAGDENLPMKCWFWNAACDGAAAGSAALAPRGAAPPAAAAAARDRRGPGGPSSPWGVRAPEQAANHKKRPPLT